ERRDFARAFREQPLLLFFDLSDAADAGADQHAAAGSVFFAEVELRIGNGFARGGDGQLREAVEAASLALLDIVLRREVFDFAGDADVVLAGVIKRHWSDAALVAEQTVPELRDGKTQRRDRSQTGDHDTPARHAHFSFSGPASWRA